MVSIYCYICSFVDLGLYIMYLLCLKALIILGYFAISFVLNEIILTLTYTSAEVLVMVILKPANTAFFPTFLFYFSKLYVKVSVFIIPRTHLVMSELTLAYLLAEYLMFK